MTAMRRRRRRRRSSWQLAAPARRPQRQAAKGLRGREARQARTMHRCEQTDAPPASPHVFFTACWQLCCSSCCAVGSMEPVTVTWHMVSRTDCRGTAAGVVPAGSASVVGRGAEVGAVRASVAKSSAERGALKRAESGAWKQAVHALGVQLSISAWAAAPGPRPATAAARCQAPGTAPHRPGCSGPLASAGRRERVGWLGAWSGSWRAHTLSAGCKRRRRAVPAAHPWRRNGGERKDAVLQPELAVLVLGLGALGCQELAEPLRKARKEGFAGRG